MMLKMGTLRTVVGIQMARCVCAGFGMSHVKGGKDGRASRFPEWDFLSFLISG